MSRRVKKLIKQVTALFLALTIVMSFALTASSDRVLHATALDEEEAASPVASVSEAEAENLAFTSESISVPAEPAPEPEPAPVEEIPIVAEAPAVIPEPEPVPESEPAAEPEAGTKQEIVVPVPSQESEPQPLPEPEQEQQAAPDDAPAELNPEAEPEAGGEPEKEAEPEAEAESEEEAEAEAEDEAEPEEEEGPEKEPEYWTLTFLDRDNQQLAALSVEKGEPVGALPQPVYREDYYAYWAVGAASEGGQGTVWTPVSRIDEGFIPSADATIVPDYDKVTYTLRFYSGADLSSAEEVAERKVDVDTSYCLNDIPEIPAQHGYSGHWEYSGGLFDNTVAAEGDMAVWAVYDQQIFHVRFLVEGELYDEATYYSGDTLALPSNPVLPGKTFSGWTADGKAFSGGEHVSTDLTLNAAFTDQISVTFIIRAEDSGMPEDEVLVQYFDSDSAVITTLPQTPFVDDRVFDKWVIQGTDTEVGVGTEIPGSMTVEAVFHPFEVYTVTATYYYFSDKNERIDFETQIIEVDRHSLPYTLQAPSSTKTDEDKVDGAPIYYPEVLSLELQEADFTDGACQVEIRYLPGSASYSFVYELKNLTGDGYTEIPGTREEVTGVIGSYVTPTVKEFDYAVLESVEAATVTEPSGQELRVRYARRNYTLAYESNGGSYIAGVTAPYGTRVSRSAVTPTREGYRFAGWYLDEGLTDAAGTAIELASDTTLYAKWEGINVNYTVVYLFEKYNETGTASAYVYDNSEVAEAVVGTEVTPSSRGVKDKSRTGWEKDTERNSKSSVVIEADGSSVLYVYYRLKEYTFYFNAGTFSSGWSSYNVNATLTGRNVSGTGTLGYTMTVKLGQDISGSWPGNVTGEYTSGSGWRQTTNPASFNGWKPSNVNTRYVTKRTSVTQDMLPSSGSSITYTAQWTTSAQTYTVNYWLQNADNDEYTRSEVYSQTYTSSSGNLSAKEISGYTYDHGNSGAQGVTTYNFYYNRDTYRIDYFVGDEKLETVSSVKFDADISGSRFDFIPSDPEHEGVYTWGGWYADAGLTTPYTFETMPASNLALYGKWIPPVYHVNFDLNGGEGEAPEQVLELGKKVARPANPVRTGHVFDGWHVGSEQGELYDWQKPVTEDLTLVARWTHTLIRYTVHYVDTEGKTLVPDRVVTNPDNEVGTEITEQAVTVAGHRPDAGSKSLVLALDGNEITFIYSSKTEKTSYTVRYLLEGTDFALAEEKQIRDVDGNTLSVLEKAAAVNYAALLEAYPEYSGLQLHPDATQKELILGSDESKNVLVFTYSSARSVQVTVRYTDMDGVLIPGVEPATRTVKMGNTFTLNRPPVPGWDLAAAVEGTALTDPAAGASYPVTAERVKSGELVFTLFYQKRLTLTAASVQKQYDGTALRLPSSPAEQVQADGLLDGDSLASFQLRYLQQDGSELEPEDGRLNAGVCLVTPADAVISGLHSGENYYSIRYLSGSLEVTKISVSVRVEPDRWTNAAYTGEAYRAGFTNPDKGITDYVRISNDGYASLYLDAIWAAVLEDGGLNHDATAPGLGYVAIEETDVGDYSYILDFTSAGLPKDSNYSVALYVRPGRLQILPAGLTVTTGSASMAYNGSALTSSEASISGLLNGETATVVTTGSQTGVGQSRNTYHISWDGTAKEENYRIKSEELGTLTVTSTGLSVSVHDRELPYNGSEQQGWGLSEETTGTNGEISTEAYSVEGLAPGHRLHLAGYLPAHGSDAGEYRNGSFTAATIRVTDTDGNDVTACYEPEVIPGALRISQATVTVTAEDKVKIFGAEEPALTAVLSGNLISGDEAQIQYSLRREPGEAAGEYRITAGGESEQGNYLVRFIDGTLRIDPAAMNLEAVSLEKVYDGIALAGGAVPGSYPDDGNTLLEYSTDGGESWTETAPERTDAGSTAYQVRATNPNYITAVADGSLAITRRPVTVTAVNSGKTFGAEDPALTVDVTGVLNSDLEQGVKIRYALSREAGENVGTYPIKVTGEAEQFNYSVSFADASFVISRSGDLVITPTDYTGVYDGGSHSIGAVPSIAEGTTLYYSTDAGASWGEEILALRDVGEVQVLIRAENPNYETAEASAAITITPLAAQIVAGSSGKVFGDEDPALTAEVRGILTADLEDGVSLSYTLSREAGEDAGRYAITVEADAEQGNYLVETVPGTFVIQPAAFSLEAVSSEKTYDGTPLSGGIAGEVPEGTVVTYSTDGGETWTEEPPALTHAGSLKYLVRAEHPNYTFSDTVGTLTMRRAAVTVTAENKAKTFGTDDPEFTAILSGELVPGEKEQIVYSFTRSPGEDVGTYPILVSGDAVQGSFGNYDVTFENAVLTISPADTLTVTATGFEGEYAGSAHTVTASASVEDGTSLSYSIDGGETWTADAPKRTDAGALHVLVRAENPNYTAAEEEVLLRIMPRAISLTAASSTREYNGSPLINSSYSQTGSFAPGEGADVTVSGSQTLPGSSTNLLQFTLHENTKAENYAITVEHGLLSVTSRAAKFELRLTPVGGSFLYDAALHRVEGFETMNFRIADADYTVEGVTARAELTNAGSVPVAVSGIPVVRDASGNNVTAQFVVNVDSAALTVTPRSVIFRSDSATAEYTGSALTADHISIEGDGFAEGEGASFTVTGSQTLTGSSENSFTWTLNDNTLASNYSIQAFPGTLTVTNRNTPYAIEVVANSASFPYDGTEHQVTGLKSYSFGIEGRVYRVSGLEASAAATHAGSYDVNITGTPVVTDGEGNDVSAQFSVTTVPGSLTILPRELTLTSDDALKPYDAIPLTAHRVRVSEPGFAPGDGVSYVFTGSRTVVGTEQNSFQYTWNEGTRAFDYRITVNFGTLTVTALPEDARFEVHVSAGSSSVLYDGEAHSVDAVTLDGGTAAEGAPLSFTRNGEHFTLSGLRAARTETNAGTYAVNVTGTPLITDSAGNNVTDQFIVIPASGSLEIRPRSVLLLSGSATHAYNGRELRNAEVTVSGDGFAEGEGATYNVTGARTLVGESRNEFTYSLNPDTLAANYSIAQEFGILRVTNRDARFEVTVRANSAEVLYDGSEHTVQGFENLRFERNGVQYRISDLTAFGSGTDAGRYPVTVRGTAAVLDAEGNDVTRQFTVTVEPGTLTVRLRQVTLTSATESRPYNGHPFQNTVITVGGDGFAEGEGADTYGFASRILPGSSENSFLWSLRAGTKEQNYSITPVFGRLSVTNRDALYEITLRANSDDEVFYDGEEHTVGGFETTEFEIDGSTYTVMGLEAEVTATEPGIHPTVITGEARVLDAEGNDVTDQFAVRVENGYLTIHDTYVLTVRFVDSRYRNRALPDTERDLAPAFTGRYASGESYGPIQAPEVKGYTPEYREIRSDAEGMPEHDVTVVLYYNADAVPVIPAGTDPTPESTNPNPAEPDPEGPKPEDEPEEEAPRAPIGVVPPEQYQATDLVVMEDPEVPLARAGAGYWALVNLIAALLTLLITILLAIVKYVGRDEDEEESDSEEERQTVSTWRLLLSLGITILAAVIFFLTEDLTNTMALVDRWTLLMLIILAVQGIGYYRATHQKEDQDPEDPQQPLPESL